MKCPSCIAAKVAKIRMIVMMFAIILYMIKSFFIVGIFFVTYSK